jgi:hypothetical protein
MAIPNTSIEAPVQDSTTTDTTPSIEFSGTNVPTSFEVQVDGGAWVVRTSPYVPAALAIGEHNVKVRGINVDGTDATPASVDFEIYPAPAAGQETTAGDADAANVNVENAVVSVKTDTIVPSVTPELYANTVAGSDSDSLADQAGLTPEETFDA